MGVVYGIVHQAEITITNPPQLLNLDVKDSFELMKVMGLFGGVTMIIIGLFLRSKNNPRG